MSRTCPYCHSELNQRNIYKGEFWGTPIIEESTNSCPNCEYEELYSYGSYEVTRCPEEDEDYE